MVPSFDELFSQKSAIAVVGLGYVGLPLAVALAEKYRVIGFDISPKRIAELTSGIDSTCEVETNLLKASVLTYTNNPTDLQQAQLIIIAVPTPIDQNRKPNLRPVTAASATVGQYMQPGTVVCYESTVFPGLTEDICVPLLEKHSGLCCGTDFFVGYSPERINPGDKVHTLSSIVKVVAGMNNATTDLLSRVYSSIIQAGIHEAPNIKTAEAAKVIENTQRDLNIALMNELAMLFDRMDIDTLDVLEAAGTKWNFLPFRPGLVGGHCIGVDPYYLTYKAEALGYHPQVILAGRRINDGVGKFIAEKTIKLLISQGVQIKGARIGILGLTFKENVPDLRNSHVVDILQELQEYQTETLVHDPLAHPAEAREEYNVELVALSAFTDLDAIIVAVAHKAFAALTTTDLGAMYRDLGAAVCIDVKGFFSQKLIQGILYWRL